MAENGREAIRVDDEVIAAAKARDHPVSWSKLTYGRG